MLSAISQNEIITQQLSLASQNIENIALELTAL